MRLREVIDQLLTAASELPMVARAEYGDVYVNWNSKSGAYGALDIAVEEITQSGMMSTAALVIYYGDRLTPARDNELDLYEDGVNVIQSVINKVETAAEEDSIILSFADYTNTPFRQQFSDELAGVYARVNVTYKNNIGQCASV